MSSMPVLTYGALHKKTNALQNLVERFNKLANCILQESNIQKKVINQLKVLYESLSKVYAGSKSSASVVIMDVEFLIPVRIMWTAHL